MAAIVRLLACHHGAIRCGPCVFCTRPYESVGCGVLLVDGLLPQGYVCLGCLAAGPRRAARGLRRRAGEARLLAICAGPRRPARERAAIRRRFRARADYLDLLSERLPLAAEWMLAGR